MSYDQEIQKLEKINEENKLEEARLQERLKTLQAEKEKINKEYEELGVKVADADKVIEATKEKIETLIAEAKKQLGVE